MANKKGMIAGTLIVRALSPDDLQTFYGEDTASCVPKEIMVNITTFLNDILEAKEKGMSFWCRWHDRLASYFDKKFGPDWKKRHRTTVR